MGAGFHVPSVRLLGISILPCTKKVAIYALICLYRNSHPKQNLENLQERLIDVTDISIARPSAALLVRV